MGQKHNMASFEFIHPSPTVQRWFEHLGLPADYAVRHQLMPVDECTLLMDVGHDIHQRPQSMHPEAAAAWQQLRQAANDEGIELQLVSAYRSFDYQAGLIQKKLDRGIALDDILQVSAAPGFSEHHTGRAIDITTPSATPLEQSFAQTSAYAWLKNHGKVYGFVESFGPNNPRGLIWEPWHWCYQPFLMAE